MNQERLDQLAKGLATGAVSRRKALRWMGGALLQRYAVVLDLGLIGCLVQYRGCRGPLLIITEPR